ncbi:CLPC homologue 1 [Actinidia rufa]|uniref:CLPC homologue 1 n=1 Tax=Actinidia rufa TaxID=165716 RepID=A0A7J0DQC3_9ERIC|nr:CLPC homologue 1 [Actinidia rufa]
MEKLEQKPFSTETLDKYGSDLTKMAKEDKLDAVIGRKQEIERVTQILCKRRKNNPCLIGEPGVGKTVIAEGLAQRISYALVPPKLCGKKVFSIDMGRLIAGASNRGEFEERLLKVVDEVEQSKGVIILFIDEVHTLIGAGAGGQALDASNILKPALTRGDVKCIGATTLDEYRKYIEKDPALKRRFQLVEVPEPSVEETIGILRGLVTKYATHHNVRYDDKALSAAARLSKQYISDRFLPDKAIDLIDEAGARLQIHQTQASAKLQVVTERDIQQLVSSWTGIPIENVSSAESIRLLKMEETLHKLIIGQDEAVEAVSRAIRRARVGLRDPNRPIVSFLFTGPTGVGKTELAKLLAVEYLGSKEAMVRLDMSEFMEKHTVSKLFGSPPGYGGHDDGGQLTEAIRRRPHNVVLFDEIEKAHQDVFNALLQILEDGRLTDCKGRTVDFKNTIIVMTSNIGGHLTGDFDRVKNQVAEELKKVFRAEFLNRLDEVIVFKGLGNLQVKEILNIMLKEVYERLQAKVITLEVTDRLKDKLVEEGYNPLYGARPMRRVITRLLENKLSEMILQGEVKQGNRVTMDADPDGEIVVDSF